MKRKCDRLTERECVQDNGDIGTERGSNDIQHVCCGVDEFILSRCWIIVVCTVQNDGCRVSRWRVTFIVASTIINLLEHMIIQLSWVVEQMSEEMTCLTMLIRHESGCSLDPKCLVEKPSMESPSVAIGQ